MKKVYVVTEGEYSNRGISAIFEDKAAAERYSEIIFGNEVEEWEISSADAVLSVPVGMVGWIVQQSKGRGYIRDGLSVRRWGVNPSRLEKGFQYNPECWGGGQLWSWEGLARDEEHAKKIFYEKYMQWCAENGRAE